MRGCAAGKGPRFQLGGAHLDGRTGKLPQEQLRADPGCKRTPTPPHREPVPRVAEPPAGDQGSG